jgi:broad specificity phosphatase PhoE
MNMRVCGFLVIALLAVACSAPAQSEPATVILVRHAEKAVEPKNDPPLSDEGRLRVQALLEATRDAGVDVIYSTNRLRNLETARPVGEALGVPVIELTIEAGGADQYVREMVDRLRKDGGGRVSLVVGHSNTFAPVIKALGGPDIEEIADERYDDIFVLTIQDGVRTRFIRGKYGNRW